MEALSTPEKPLVGNLLLSDDVSWESVWRRAAEDSKTAESNSNEDMSDWESQMKTELNRRHYLRRMREEISSTVNAYAVVLVLLASVTFVLYLQPPGGFDPNGILNIVVSEVNRFLDDTSNFILFASVSFHLAVTGILVCLSCIAFIIPSERAYPEGMFMGEMNLRDYALNLSLTEKQQLHSTLFKINNRVSLALKVARVLGTVTNLFLVTSVWSCVYVAEVSLFLVLPQSFVFDKATAWTFSICSIIFSVMFCLYVLALLWNIFNPAADILADAVIAISYIICRVVRSIYTFSKKAINTLKKMNTSTIMNTICTRSLLLVLSIATRLMSWVAWTLKRPRLCVRWSLRIVVIIVFIVNFSYVASFIGTYVFLEDFYLFNKRIA